jgi:hypothetical protein
MLVADDDSLILRCAKSSSNHPWPNASRITVSLTCGLKPGPGVRQCEEMQPSTRRQAWYRRTGAASDAEQQEIGVAINRSALRGEGLSVMLRRCPRGPREQEMEAGLW